VGGKKLKVIESGRLPNNWSFQTCELLAFDQALKFLKVKEGTIYTDSKYAFGIVYTFGKIWVERGLIYNRGQDLIHEELIIKLLKSLMLPEETTIVHVPGHQRSNSPEAQGNNLADMAANEAAFHPELQMLHLTPIIQVPFMNPFFTPLERVRVLPKPQKGNCFFQMGEKYFLSPL
jgi:ribonuclease HI